MKQKRLHAFIHHSTIQATQILTTAILIATFTSIIHPYIWHTKSTEQEFPHIPITQILQHQYGIIIVDARQEAEYQKGHILNAISLNDSTWEKQLPILLGQYESDMPIVIYCDSNKCNSSNRIARRLWNETKLKNIKILEGGWSAWKQAELTQQ